VVADLTVMMTMSVVAKTVLESTALVYTTSLEVVGSAEEEEEEGSIHVECIWYMDMLGTFVRTPL